jgi:protein phosphatase
MSGKKNEDRFGIAAFQVSRINRTPALFAILADGIGGSQAGEVAAELAVELITRSVAQSDSSHPVRTLMQAYFDANTAIRQTADMDSDKTGMGTTATSAWIIGDRLYGANIGNSRLYLLRRNRFIQLTMEHSWVQEAIEYGVINQEQARNHPNARIITRYLGAEKAYPDFRLRLGENETDDQMESNQGIALLPGDQVFLCCDGLTDLVKDYEIAQVLKQYPLETALDRLIMMANMRGGHDNITALLLQVPREEPVPAAQPAKQKMPGNLVLGILGAAFILSVLVLLFLTARTFF